MSTGSGRASYSAAARVNIDKPQLHDTLPSNEASDRPQHVRRAGNHTGTGKDFTQRKRTPSPSHIPKTTSQDETVYVVTLLTDKPHHDTMTELRNQYFPKAINKLAAHLTLFHALPGSKLEDSIIPVLEQVASRTTAFRINATKAFRLKRGIAISVEELGLGTGSSSNIQQRGKQVHHQLQSLWKEESFLSDQDAGGCRLHYTIMNKVDDEALIAKALKEIRETWKGHVGMVEGLGLWRYDRGSWRWQRKFAFRPLISSVSNA